MGLAHAGAFSVAHEFGNTAPSPGPAGVAFLAVIAGEELGYVGCQVAMPAFQNFRHESYVLGPEHR